VLLPAVMVKSVKRMDFTPFIQSVELNVTLQALPSLSVFVKARVPKLAVLLVPGVRFVTSGAGAVTVRSPGSTVAVTDWLEVPVVANAVPGAATMVASPATVAARTPMDRLRAIAWRRDARPRSP